MSIYGKSENVCTDSITLFLRNHVRYEMAVATPKTELFRAYCKYCEMLRRSASTYYHVMHRITDYHPKLRSRRIKQVTDKTQITAFIGVKLVNMKNIYTLVRHDYSLRYIIIKNGQPQHIQSQAFHLNKSTVELEDIIIIPRDASAIC